MMLTKFTVFRSGYTGEDGVEVVIPAKMAGMAMKMLAGKMDKPDATIKPAGLGARDTLRLEAGMPLYGHELGEDDRSALGGLGLGGGSEEGFRRRRAASRDRRRRARSENWSAWSWKAGASPGRERRSMKDGADRRRSHQRHVRPDRAEEHRDGVRRCRSRGRGNAAVS